LQNFFAKPDSSEADRQSRDRSFNWHNGKKINQWHADTQSVRGKQERCKSCKMRYDRRAERNEGCPPVMRIQMIGCEDLDQFIASRKMSRKKAEEFESTYDERRNQEGNRCAKKGEQQPEQISGLRFLGKKIVSH